MPPTPESDLLPRAQPIELTVALEPAANIINSMLLLSSGDTLSGLDEWVVRTAARLTPEQMHRNRLVLEGMYHAVLPERRWPSFDAYLSDLAASKPEVLRDRLMWHITHSSKQAPPSPGAPPRQLADPRDLLASAEAYIGYLRSHFWEFDEA